MVRYRFSCVCETYKDLKHSQCNGGRVHLLRFSTILRRCLQVYVETCKQYHTIVCCMQCTIKHHCLPRWNGVRTKTMLCFIIFLHKQSQVRRLATNHAFVLRTKNRCPSIFSTNHNNLSIHTTNHLHSSILSIILLIALSPGELLNQPLNCSEINLKNQPLSNRTAIPSPPLSTAMIHQPQYPFIWLSHPLHYQRQWNTNLYLLFIWPSRPLHCQRQ